MQGSRLKIEGSIPDDENGASKAAADATNQALAASSHSSVRNATDGDANRVPEDDDGQGWGSSSSRALMDAAAGNPSSTSAGGEGAAGNTSSPSSMHRATFASPPSVIEIVDAQKSGDGGSSFIVYVIRNASTEAKRRYSEFEALREALVRLHPTIIIAPIPSKHTLSDYAAKQSKAKEDATIIARRKRMLQSFLRRCDNHPKLRGDEVLQKFLDGRYHWNDITASPPMVHLSKNNLRAPVQNPADPHASPAYAHLPLPSSVSSLRQPNQRFIDSEAFTNRFANHLSGSMEKVNRRLMRRWTEASTDYAELGATLNGFSLTESGQLATAIERQDRRRTRRTLQRVKCSERGREVYGTFARKVLKWRHLKHLQYELAQDALEAKKTQLEELERVENEAKRLDEALERGGAGLLSNNGGDQEPDSTSNSKATDANPSSTTTDARARSRATSPPASPSKRASSRSTGYGLLGAITHTFQSVMDVDRDASAIQHLQIA
ncbi:uncharacterized protein UDID_18610 [Ustilago sp. UG-2017a]|nr:uncharacterized protein UDID_18610 [Ustilago sp. UG-2017a]